VAESAQPDIVVHVCTNCLAEAWRLPRQWRQDGVYVLVRQVPCSGKIDAQYLLNALEGGGRGFCVVTCPKGECQLGQGNYRAEIRVRTIRRLLREIGLQGARAQLLQCSPDEPFESFEKTLRDAVARIAALGDPRTAKTA